MTRILKSGVNLFVLISVKCNDWPYYVIPNTAFARSNIKLLVVNSTYGEEYCQKRVILIIHHSKT